MYGAAILTAHPLVLTAPKKKLDSLQKRTAQAGARAADNRETLDISSFTLG